MAKAMSSTPPPRDDPAEESVDDRRSKDGAAHEEEEGSAPRADSDEVSTRQKVGATRDVDGSSELDPRARRPRYLVIALVAALVFGAGCWTEGCSRLAFFRGERDHGAALNESIHDEGDRTQAEALYQRFVDSADAQRGRGVPLAAATFVLGAALLTLAARGLAGKSNTRSAIIQVVAAQAIVVGASFFALREMKGAEADWEYQSALFHQRERLPPDQYDQVAATMQSMRRWQPPAWLAFRTMASALIILALSRPRSREFFEAAAASAER